MKKKVISLLLALLMIFASMPLTLLSVAAEGISSIADGGDDVPVVSIEPVDKHTKTDEYGGVIAKPDASGYAHFIIKATGEITDDITVYYATEDLSAIAAAGDYEAKSGSVVLTEANPEVQISVKTEKSEYSIATTPDYSYSSKDGYVFMSRSFKVKLTGVSANAEIDKDAKEVKCSLNADHWLDAVKYDGATVLRPFTYHGKYEIYNFLTSPTTCGSDETVSKTVALNFPAYWAADYIDGGIDAKLYLSLKDAHVDESWWNSSSGITVNFLDNVTIKIKGEFHDNEEFGWGPAFLYVKNGVENGQDGVEDKYKDYYNENYESVEWDYFWGDWDLKKAGLIYNLTTSLNSKIVIRRRYSFGEPNEKSNDPGEYYIGLADGVLKKTSTVVSLTSHGGYSRKLTSGTASFRLEDIIAPKIEQTTSGEYAIYHNFDTVTKGEKLRVAIRFNEPVQVNGNKPFFTGKVNGLGTGIEPHVYAIKFSYVGGSGTDTLYFESDYTGDFQINSITDIQFKYANSITDFGGVANSFTPDANFVIDGFNLDRRTPHISVPLGDSKQETWGKSKSVTVTVSNISEDTVLYYAWTDSITTPQSFEDQITLNNVSVNGTQSVTIFGGGEGVKYLHLKAVSRYGKVQSHVSVTGSLTASQSCLGPYKFDNVAPTIDDTASWLVNSESDLTKKTYSIPVPHDSSTKNIELKMYYIDETGETHALENKTYKFTEKDTKPVKIELTAADVGLDDEITRREVTVFFTLTDEVGNTRENVARHNTVFDTREYIKVEYAGSAQGFIANTESLNEGYVFVYNGSVQSEDGGICYSFVFEGIDNPPDGQTFVFINKNGVSLPDGNIEAEDHIVDGKLVGITVKFYSPVEEGYYDIYLGCFRGGVTEQDRQNGRLPDYISETYRIYLGSGKGKLDEQVEKGTMLINKVYQLPSASYFYYMDTNGTIGTVSREAYNRTTLPASFSSQSKALEYVLFNEYRDLYPVTLTADLAEALNAGNSNVQKALGEETVAREGQVWIRYKSASCDVSKTPLTSDWVFYYYGSSEDLHVQRFSKLLTDALNSVSSRITARGTTVALTDFSLANSGSSSTVLDKLGAPYLAPLQIHAEDKRLSEQRRNGNFIVDVTFIGDKAIYSSEVIIKDSQYLLIGNVIIPVESRFQYKRIDESGMEAESWTDIVYTQGQCFRDVLTESGTYKIRELGEGGVSTFNVYIDGDAPMVLVSWRDKEGNANSQILNQSSEKEFRAKSFKIVGIDAREYDKYSYVAIYNAATEKLYGVYMLTDLQKTSVDLPDGNYYMVVADRSGNRYTMTLHLNSSQLNCDIKEVENVKIKFTCDRKETQIQEFYVKRNGVLVSGKYAAELEFTESGTYEFYVRDIYGNVFGPYVHNFSRVYPTVTWKYRDESGHYVTYDPEKKTKYFTLESIVDGTFSMSTSTTLKFQVSDGYGYTFLGVVPEHSENPGDGTVTIKNTQAFQLKVYYKKHPEVYTIYNCSADTVAPIIQASVQIDTLVPDEIEEMRQQVKGLIASGAVLAVGSKLAPTKISYSLVDTRTKYLVNNDQVLSDFIKVEVQDESGLAYVRVYLNGTPVKEQSGEDAAADIVLSKAGTYKIVAEDALGNKSEFNFTNGRPTSFSYVVDALPYVVGLRDHEKFDKYGNFNDTTFGNDSVSFIIEEHMQVFYKITDSQGRVYFVSFDVGDGVVREVYYSVDSENNLVLQTAEAALLDINDSKTVVNKEYAVYEIKEIGVKIYARITSSGNIALTVYANDDPTLLVEARLNTEDNEFYYTKTALSIYSPTLAITSNGVTDTIDTKDIVKINNSFTIERSNFVSDKITYVEVYYSNTNDFELGTLFFMENIYRDGAYYDKEGFYLVRMLNEFGNESMFIIHISCRFDITSYTEFADGQKVHYSASYTETLYSNNKIVFEVYADGVTVTVKKDGSAYRPVITIENGVTYVILSEPGSYTVDLCDSYNNSIERSAEISFTNIGFREDILTGYNENALKKDEGYTNRKLSINKAVIDEERICYLAVQYGDTLEVLYDNISEFRVPLDESNLTEIIGSLGDGEYTVVARNRYGAILAKVIHYRETPTLILEREIRSSTETEVYDINKALSIGFWSNSELIFKSEAEYYIFTINEDRTECPKKLAFISSEQQGRSEYDITYIDEYGFSYSFKAYLVRQDIEITLDLGSEALNIDGLLTTTEDIAVLFSESAICTYTLNNSAEKLYTPGEKLSRDGTYRFVAVDYAGNVSALTIKKDTIVEFEFVEANSSASLQSGGVVNSSKVEFKTLNGDTAYIEKVFKDGVVQTDSSSTKFTEDGKWEFIISDKLGNKSYFCFYIITKQKSELTYTTPYEYRVTELWYDSGDDVKISYLKFVNQNESSSSFTFVENGTYTVVMTSSVTGSVSRFEFTINTNPPKVSLVGCNPGDTTINDVTVTGCVVGDTVKVYRITKTGEELVKVVEVTTISTKMPTITEGGEYRIVVESEAGVETELSFVRKHVLNTTGSVFIMIVIAVAVIGLFVGLVYRNKSKTDK